MGVFSHTETECRSFRCLGDTPSFWESSRENLSGDARLLQLCDQLQLTVKASKASSTSKAYGCWEKRFRGFCADHNICALPASPFNTALFLQFLRSTGLSHSSVMQAASAIKWMHEAEMEQDPTEEAVVKKFLQGDRRRGDETLHKEPATVGHLREIRQFHVRHPTDKNFRTLVMASMAFHGCFRLSDYRALRRKHINFNENGDLLVTIPSAKNDQFREGALQVIPPREQLSEICAVKLMQTWLTLPCLPKSSDDFLFPRLTCPSKVIADTSFRDG